MDGDGDPGVDRIREEIAELDRTILEAAARRVHLARELGEAKRAQGRPAIDLLQEKRVLERARRTAEAALLDGATAAAIVDQLIQASVKAQEQDMVVTRGSGTGRTCVLMGGAGRMGRWFNRFLQSHGYDVHLIDPAYGAAHNDAAATHLYDADLVLMAIPPRAIARQYEAWAEEPPQGVIADMASVKSPLVPVIQQLREGGGRVASFHPMFGPSTLTLRDADVVLCDTGDEEATAAIEHLFAPTAANVIHIGLDEHDQVMAQVLALGHATAIAFAASLDPATLPVHSTTFSRLEAVAASVVDESPEVYFEIQADNPHAASSVEHLRHCLERLQKAVAKDDRTAFSSLMQAGKDALDSRADHRRSVVP